MPLIYANSGRQAVDALIESLRDVNTKEQASTQLALVSFASTDYLKLKK